MLEWTAYLESFVNKGPKKSVSESGIYYIDKESDILFFKTALQRAEIRAPIESNLQVNPAFYLKSWKQRINLQGIRQEARRINLLRYWTKKTWRSSSICLNPIQASQTMGPSGWTTISSAAWGINSQLNTVNFSSPKFSKIWSRRVRSDRNYLFPLHNAKSKPASNAYPEFPIR